MLNLVSTSPNYLQSIQSANVGYLATPQTFHNVPDGMAFALDNDCFNRYNPNRIIATLKKYSAIDRCLFAVVPDSVGNAIKTTTLFRWWYPVYQRYKMPCAYVLQDGVTPDMIPYNQIKALFIGGSTEFKLSAYAAAIVEDAKRRGLWVHMGRVNSINRIIYAQGIGCDSFDGTQYSMFPKTYIKAHLPYHTNYQYNFLELVA